MWMGGAISNRQINRLLRLGGNEMMHIEDMEANHLDILISEYNWDNGFHVPKMVIESKNCELATAMRTFYLSDGYSYLLNNIHENTERFKFISCLFERILTGHFSKGGLSFKIPLTKTQKYKLKKSNVPDVFLIDI